MGTNIAFVRSVELDHWKEHEIQKNEGNWKRSF